MAKFLNNMTAGLAAGATKLQAASTAAGAKVGEAGAKVKAAAGTAGTAVAAAGKAAFTKEGFIAQIWALALVMEILTLHMCIKRAWAEEDEDNTPLEQGIPLVGLGASDANWVIFGMTFFMICMYVLNLLRKPIMMSGTDGIPGYPMAIAWGSFVMMCINFIVQLSMGMTFFRFGNGNTMDWMTWVSKGLSSAAILQTLANETGWKGYGPFDLLWKPVEMIV